MTRRGGNHSGFKVARMDAWGFAQGGVGCIGGYQKNKQTAGSDMGLSLYLTESQVEELALSAVAQINKDPGMRITVTRANLESGLFTRCLA
jgi:hypothetical protein